MVKKICLKIWFQAENSWFSTLECQFSFPFIARSWSMNEVSREVGGLPALYILKSAILKPEQKEKTFAAVFSNQLSEITLLFVNLLIKHGREGHLEEVFEKYIAQYLKENKIVRAQISSSSPLLKEQKDRLLSLLNFGETSSILLDEKIDPELIGGFILRVGDQQINASASEALSQLEQEFNKNSYIADF